MELPYAMGIVDTPILRGGGALHATKYPITVYAYSDCDESLMVRSIDNTLSMFSVTRLGDLTLGSHSLPASYIRSYTANFDIRIGSPSFNTSLFRITDMDDQYIMQIESPFGGGPTVFMGHRLNPLKISNRVLESRFINIDGYESSTDLILANNFLHLPMRSNTTLGSDLSEVGRIVYNLESNKIKLAIDDGGSGVEIHSLGTEAWVTNAIASAIDKVTRETPSGLINSSNVTYTLANTPVTGTEELFKNGILMDVGSGNDYTISINTITMTSPPTAGDKLLVSYFK